MSKVASAIRFEPEEKEWITAFAKMEGNTFSSQVRLWVLERLEDELDARDLAAAVAEDDGTRIGWDDLKQELGI